MISQPLDPLGSGGFVTRHAIRRYGEVRRERSGDAGLGSSRTSLPMAARRGEYWGSCVATSGALSDLLADPEPGDLIIATTGRSEVPFFVGPDGSVEPSEPPGAHLRPDAVRFSEFASARDVVELEAAGGPGRPGLRRAIASLVVVATVAIALSAAASGLFETDRRVGDYRVEACVDRELGSIRCQGDVRFETEWLNGDSLYGAGSDALLGSPIDTSPGATFEVVEYDRSTFFRVEDRRLVRVIASSIGIGAALFGSVFLAIPAWRLAPPRFAPAAQRGFATLRQTLLLAAFVVPIGIVIVAMLAGIDPVQVVDAR